MQVLLTGTSLLHRLQFYELAARFLVAGSQLLDLPQTEDPVPMRDASLMVSEASSALISLAEALSEPWTVREPAQAAIPDLGAATGGTWGTLHICSCLPKIRLAMRCSRAALQDTATSAGHDHELLP